MNLAHFYYDTSTPQVVSTELNGRKFIIVSFHFYQPLIEAVKSTSLADKTKKTEKIIIELKTNTTRHKWAL